MQTVIHAEKATKVTKPTKISKEHKDALLIESHIANEEAITALLKIRKQTTAAIETRITETKGVLKAEKYIVSHIVTSKRTPKYKEIVVSLASELAEIKDETFDEKEYLQTILANTEEHFTRKLQISVTQ